MLELLETTPNIACITALQRQIVLDPKMVALVHAHSWPWQASLHASSSTSVIPR